MPRVERGRQRRGADGWFASARKVGSPQVESGTGPRAPGAVDASTVKREIEQAVREALTVHGVSGQVVLQGRILELHAGRTPIAIDIEALADQWPLLPE